MVFVSLAGPATNLSLMAVAAVVSRWIVRQGRGLGGAIDVSTSDLLLEIVFFFAVVNLLLGLFNLLPIPPLDGSALLERLLPHEWLPAWYRFRPYGLLVLLFLVFFTGLVGRIVTPFYDLLYDFVVR
jgi:Zn-dependent protease